MADSCYQAGQPYRPGRHASTPRVGISNGQDDADKEIAHGNECYNYVLSGWDPHLIAEIPVWSKIDPLPLPNSVLTILWNFNTMLPFPWTLTDPWDLQHYIITLWDLQMTSEIPDHISVFIILF